MPNIVHVMLMAQSQAPISPQHSVARLSVFNKVMVVRLRLSSRLRPRPKLLPLTAGANRLSTVMLDMAARPAARKAAGANRLSTVMLDMAARPAASTAAGAVKLVMAVRPKASSATAAEVMEAIKLAMVANK